MENSISVIGEFRLLPSPPRPSNTTALTTYNGRISQRAGIPTHLFMLCTCFLRIKTITLYFVSACHTHITADHPLGSDNDSECWEEYLGPTLSRQETWIVCAQCIPQSASCNLSNCEFYFLFHSPRTDSLAQTAFDSETETSGGPLPMPNAPVDDCRYR